jgi:DNA-binding MarR family transcriptional regulator
MVEKTAGVSPTEWETWRSFSSMRRQLELALEHQLQRDAGISMSDYGVLLTLFEAPGRQLRARELGALLAWEKSRVSHQVSRMEKRGLVERRECDTDARGTWIAMTNDGRRAVLGAMRDHASTLRAYFFDVLSPEQLSAIRSVSTSVLDALEPQLCGELETDQ